MPWPVPRATRNQGADLLRASRNRAVLVSARAEADQLPLCSVSASAFSVTTLEPRGLAAGAGVPGDGRQAEEHCPSQKAPRPTLRRVGGVGYGRQRRGARRDPMIFHHLTHTARPRLPRLGRGSVMGRWPLGDGAGPLTPRAAADSGRCWRSDNALVEDGVIAAQSMGRDGEEQGGPRPAPLRDPFSSRTAPGRRTPRPVSHIASTPLGPSLPRRR
jgi:hypothetical protein